MPITTQLILISEQPIPNLTPLLDKELRPAKVIMLVSDKMQAQANALQNILKPKGIQVERYRVTDPLNIEAMQNLILDILDAYKPGEIALNATGGTKPMAIAAYDVFREFKHPVFYVQDQLIWLYPKNKPQALAQHLKLKDYLSAYGADLINMPDHTGVIAPVHKLTETLVNNMGIYANELGTLNYLALKAKNQQLCVEIEDGPQARPHLWDIFDIFAAAGLCTINGHRLTFSNETARFTANGGWLESYAYGLCLKLKKSKGIQDIANNITIERQSASANPVKNEIDIGLIYANSLHIIECKTKRFKENNDTDILYKLDSLRDLMGGLQSKAMLVSFNRLEKSSLARAKELKIELCCHSELRNLHQHLEHWLSKKDNF
ncbi:DUF1887 family protein [Methylomonas paludis]|uniref:DUF1887 family protein n=1 Tax=Methylomonas paludis TaxID=1173101 RepID=A0A975MPB8_9GAMM|nr:DUF1887 family CARF protein [Methylomonas paludis]QWF71551.1 DUF1887 family protein [Methylomonas paludis]